MSRPLNDMFSYLSTMNGIIKILFFTVFIASQVAFANVIDDFCLTLTKTLKCDATAKYRAITGTCNNLKYPYLGSVNTRLARLLTPRYGDGLSTPPKSVTGADLPSARLISLNVFNDVSVPDTKLTLAAMQFGQFVAHDMANTLRVIATTVDCCSGSGVISSTPSAKCYYIPVPPNDPVHTREQCLGFARDFADTDAACFPNMSQYPAQQVNSVTGFLDLSLIYGSAKSEVNSVRSFVDGQLLTVTTDGQIWPPQDPKGICNTQSSNETCFFGVDWRMNQSPQLTILHILFTREHNRIALLLKALNPTWVDETLFQEARRINIAQYQKIVYYEWLPQILGLTNMQNAGIYFQSSGTAYSTDYSQTIDPSVINEFTGSAFRFFHTQIEGYLNGLAEDRSTTGVFRLSDVLFIPDNVKQGNNFQSICRGMTYQTAQSMDRNIHAEVRTYFNKRNQPFGDDLKAIDIQRDRDHGIASYNTMRAFIGLPRATKWEDYLDWINADDIARLQSVYASYEDVDLNVGGALERPVDSTVGYGPTYQYLFLNQFKNLRAGDRFWFESNASPGAFTPTQLGEIRKSSLARIICDNSGGITTMQKNVFIVPGGGNNIIDCGSISSINLGLWKV